MAAGLTNYGVSRINALAGEEGGLDIDRMVFALIPGIDHTEPIDKTQGLPTAGQIKYTAIIPEDYKGYVTEDQVVYSVILGSDLGNWSFNAVCLVEAVTDEVVAVLTLPETAKYKTDLQSNTVGNMITRNFVLSYQDVKALTGITFNAETWQFDYVGEMNAHGALIVDPTKEGTEPKHVTNTQAKKWEDHADSEHVPTSHVNTVVDPTTTGTDKKHVTNTQAKKWEDHVNDPHDYSLPHNHPYAPLSHSHAVSQKATRTTKGTWTISGLAIGVPAILTIEGSGTYTNYIKYRVASGALGGTSPDSSLYYSMSFWNDLANSTPHSVIIIPTASTICISVVDIKSATLRLYQ